MLALVLVGGISVGCQTSKMNPPSGFVEVDSYGEFRAVSPEGITLAYKAQNNPETGDLAFWSKAVKRSLVQKGHTFEQEEKVETRSGMNGVLLKLTKMRSGTQFTYWVALYVRGAKVHVVQAGGKSEDFESHSQEIRKSMQSL
jgi:hypothetical protein